MTPHADGTPHHWKLDTPGGGREVSGRCLGCDAVRDFTVAWTDDEFVRRARKRPLPDPRGRQEAKS